jgi:hypothetical protein
MERNDSSRREAERLAAAALAAASFAAKNLSRRMAANARASERRDARGGGDSRESPRSSGPFDDLSALVGIASRFLGDAGRRDSYDRRDDRRDDRRRDNRSAHHVANGSDECCMCPVCRVISAVRDPSPEFSERIASGASDLAAGVATVMRAFGNAGPGGRGGRGRRAGSRPDDGPVVVNTATIVDDVVGEDDLVVEELDFDDLGGVDTVHVPVTAPAEAKPPASLWSDFSSIWQAATRAPFDESAAPAPTTSPVASKPVAKKAVAKKVAKKAVATKATAPSGSTVTEPAAKAVPTKAVPVKATVTKATAAKASAATAPVKKATAKAVPAKTSAAKAAPAKTVPAKTVPAKTVPAKKAAARKAPAKKAAASPSAQAGATPGPAPTPAKSTVQNASDPLS